MSSFDINEYDCLSTAELTIVEELSTYNGRTMFSHLDDQCTEIEAIKKALEAVLIPEIESSFSDSTVELTCVRENEMKVNRLTVGDFAVIPEGRLDVDEERCLVDAQYRRAIQYLEEIGTGIAEEVFNKDKQYRDAINMLIGAVSIAASRELEEEVLYFCNLEDAACTFKVVSRSPKSPMVLRNNCLRAHLDELSAY